MGTHQVFVNTARDPGNPWRLPQPPSVVVVGLGDEGTLREAELEDSVRQGVLAWSQRQAEEPARAGAALRARGHAAGQRRPGHQRQRRGARHRPRGAQANVTLAEAGWPLVSRLMLVELYLDRASDAWQRPAGAGGRRPGPLRG